MKKLIINMLLLFGITIAATAQAYDPVPMAVTPANLAQNNAWYYAAQNDYATEMYKSYWAWDKASSTWVKRVELIVPAPVTKPDPRYRIIPKGDDVCLTNCLMNTTPKPGGQ